MSVVVIGSAGKNEVTIGPTRDVNVIRVTVCPIDKLHGIFFRPVGQRIIAGILSEVRTVAIVLIYLILKILIKICFGIKLNGQFWRHDAVSPVVIQKCRAGRIFPTVAGIP